MRVSSWNEGVRDMPIARTADDLDQLFSGLIISRTWVTALLEIVRKTHTIAYMDRIRTCVTMQTEICSKRKNGNVVVF